MILNGYEPVVSQLDKYEMVIRVASSEMDERGAAEWLRKSFRAKG
jgi:prophage maintenance system killer protein